MSTRERVGHDHAGGRLPLPRGERAEIHGHLLAPINAVVELSELLLKDVEERDDAAFADDLGKIRDSGLVCREQIRSLLDPPPGESWVLGARQASLLRHDLRNPLSTIIGYCELWIEDAEEHFVEGFLNDLTTIRDLGRQILIGIDVVLKPPPALPPIVETEVPTALNGWGRLRAESTDPDVERGAVAAHPGDILVVDDNETGRGLLVRRLRKQGHRVVQASGGQPALELAATAPFDLILLDVLMPGMDGFEVLRKLKASAATRAIPVIMITGLDDLDGAVRSIELGAEDYLPRPFNGVLLDARIRACLEKKRLQDRERTHLLAIEQERQRYDELLRSILPGRVIDELKVSRRVKPARHEGVAVLFADLVGFTRYCDGHQPEDVVGVLERLIEDWDRVAAEHRIEKIKNIGDGFLAARGLLEPAEDPVWDCLRCGQKLIEAARGLGAGWDARVGIHFGPVIAGLLGRRQFLFDIWGDTVNTASRVESNGLPGRVSLSAHAYGSIRDRLPRLDRRLVDVKGKGHVELFSIDCETNLDLWERAM
jgi:class 3 adenylate cyclase